LGETTLIEIRFPNPIRLVGFDLDGTLIQGNTWNFCHDRFGLSEGVNRIWRDQYRAGEISYQDWLQHIAEAYRKNGVNRSQFVDCLSNFSLMPDATKVIRTLLNRGFHLAIVSGTFNTRVELVAEKLQIPHWRANVGVIFNPQGDFDQFSSRGSPQDIKACLFREICDEAGVDLEEAVFVGNDVNDLPIFSMTKRGILINNDDPVMQAESFMTIRRLSDLYKIISYPDQVSS
jgi:HAD superfamily phosphoserine phosphatase-like hydrolase